MPKKRSHLSANGWLLHHSMRVVFSIFLLFITSNLFSQTNEFPFRPGEQLVYSVHYHWGLFWTEAGEVVFKADTIHHKELTVIQMQSFGRSLPKFDWLFKVRDTFSSDAVYPGMNPLYFKRANYEGKDWVRNYYTFDREKGVIHRDMESNKTKRNIDTILLPEEQILDIQTAVYYARFWDLKRRKPGDQLLLRLIIAGKFYSIPLTYAGKEIIKHKNGKFYSCHKIVTKVVAGLIFSDNQEITIYVSDDGNQIPLVVKAPILVGFVEAYLKETKEVEFPQNIDY